MKKAGKKTITLVLGLVALVCMVLSTVSVFFTLFKTDAQKKDDSVTISSTRLVVGELKSEEDIAKDYFEAIKSSDESAAKTEMKNMLAHSIAEVSDKTAFDCMILMFTTLTTLLFGLVAAALSLASAFGKAKVVAIVFQVLTAVVGLVAIIAASSIVKEIGTGLLLGSGPILAMVFAVVAAGVTITNKVLGKKNA